MTVNPGFAAGLIEAMLPKIEKIRGWIEAADSRSFSRPTAA